MVLRSLRQLKPNMVLTKPVYDRHGVLLLTPKTILTQSNIRMLKSWGAMEVWVEGGDKSGNGDSMEPERDIIDALENDLNEKFSDVCDNRIMMEIKKVAAKQLLKRYLKKKRVVKISPASFPLKLISKIKMSSLK